MNFTPHPSFRTRLIEFLAFFIPLNIFLTLLWFLWARSSPLLLVSLITNTLFALYFLLRWKTIKGSSTLFQSFKTGASKFGYGINTLITSILLFIVYILGVGLTSLIGKLFRKKFLSLKPEAITTYYEDHPQTFDEESYYRQF